MAHQPFNEPITLAKVSGTETYTPVLAGATASDFKLTNSLTGGVLRTLRRATTIVKGLRNSLIAFRHYDVTSGVNVLYDVQITVRCPEAYNPVILEDLMKELSSFLADDANRTAFVNDGL